VLAGNEARYARASWGATSIDLSFAVLQGKAQGADGFINLVGLLIGNAWTDAAIDNAGAAAHWQCVPARVNSLLLR